MTMTAPAARMTAAPAADRCATCASPFTARNDAQLYCSAECRRLAARLSGLRIAADGIVDAAGSATRLRAVFGLRRVLVAAVSAGVSLPETAEKADRHGEGPRAGSDRRRRWCACCRSDLGELTGRGRPPVSCRANTGRKCARYRNRAQEVAELADVVAAKAADTARARRAILRTVTEINAEIGLEYTAR